MTALKISHFKLAPIALCLAQTVWAQTAPAPSNTPTVTPSAATTPATLREVKVESSVSNDSFGGNALSNTRLPADLKDLPQSAIVVNQALMKSQGATSLSSALKNVPGLTIAGAEGGQIGNNINLNGFSARTDIFLDGARDRGQYYRDTFALDSIEVLMGPSSMLFGRGSTGGVINQVTKSPKLKAASEVQASVSSNGLVRTLLDHNTKLSDTSAFRVAMMGQQGNTSDRNHSATKDYGIAPSLKLGIGTPTQITFSGLIQRNQGQTDYGLPNLNGAPVIVDRKTSYAMSDDRTISNIGSMGAVIEHKITPTSSVRNQTQFNKVKTDVRETSPQGIGTLTGVGGAFVALSTGTTAIPVAASSSLPYSQLYVRRQSRDRVIQDQSTYNLTEFTTQLQTGGIKHDVLAGFEVGRESYNNQVSYRNGSCNGTALNTAGATTGYVDCTPLSNPSDAANTVASTLGNLQTGKAVSTAVFANDTLELSPKVKLVGGLRRDRYGASITNSISSATVLAATEQTVNFTSVRSGFIFQPTSAQTYYLSGSTSFNPSLEQLVSTTGGTQPLPPQQNRATELGAKWDLRGGDLSLTAAAFKITQYNARAQDATNSALYTATGTVQVQGARMGIAGKVSTKWQWFGGYTRLNASIVDAIAPLTAGKIPANTPKDSLSLWSTYNLTKEWEVGGGASYMSSRFMSNTNLTQVPSYVRWDSVVAYHQPKYDVRLNIYNLANKYYYDSLVPSDGGRAVPGGARSATISVAYRF